MSPDGPPRQKANTGQPIRRIGAVAVFVLVLAGIPNPAAEKPVRAAKPDPGALAFFEQKVRPVLANRCYRCHGPQKQKNGLRVDSLAAILKGGVSGPAVKPGNPDDSLLISAIRHGEALQMPPQIKLPPKEIADLTSWVKMGAPWPNAIVSVQPASSADVTTGGPDVATFTPEQKSFWAFRPPADPPLPPVKNSAWVRTPVDRFVLSKLEEKGLQPASAADRRTLIRRATFDLIGLPPTPAETDAFLADESPEAFAKVVDRLLASPHYGERWGRRWLDIARYADSNGMDENLAYGNAWRYRDYVVEAFNKDKPYDQFVREQIAGDLLVGSDPIPVRSDPIHRVSGKQGPMNRATTNTGPMNRATTNTLAHERLIATGFLALGPKMLAEDDPVKMQMDIVDEQIDTIGRTFMGLTLGCARCHDHKFDPIPTADYYALAGIFKSTRTMDNFSVVARWHERPVAAPDELRRAHEHERLVAEKKSAIDRLVQQAGEELVNQERKHAGAYLLAAAELRRQELLWPSVKSVMAAASNGKAPAGGTVIEAEAFARGNVVRDFDHYGKGIGVIYNRGQLPNFAEYDVTLAAAGTYQLECRYAAAESRPVNVFVNGQLVRTDAAGEVTGSWFPDTQKWSAEAVVTLRAGKNLVRLERAQPFPHFDKLALVPCPGKEPVIPRTAEQIAAERKLNPEFLKQWTAYLKQKGSPPDDAALQKVVHDPAGPFAVSTRLEPSYPAPARDRLRALRQELGALEKAKPPLSEAMAVEEGTVGNCRIHIRGSHWTQGREVPRRFLQIIAGPDQKPIDTRHSGRLELASWLTRPDHPLTARVMANRLWMGHFGEGLVRTPDNFGRLGEAPANQPLLDWLAVRFVRTGWSMKAMHRLIMTSSAYQMSTAYDERAAAVDPENRLFWRMNRRRLEAEAIRDAILAVSGQLDPALGGSLFRGNNRAYVPGYPNSSYNQYDFNRRSLYLPVIRSDLYSVFQAFDFADPSVPNGERATTTVAPQALFMMNSKLVLQQSTHLARELLREPAPADTARLRRAYEVTLGRPPTGPETTRALDFVRRIEQALAADKVAPPDRRVRAWQSLCRVLIGANEFIYVE